MEIIEINKKADWDGFMQKIKEKSFLDSWEWGEFQIGQGHPIRRFGVVDNSVLLAAALAVKIKARRGTYILIQHGPTVASKDQSEKQEILKELFFRLADWGKQEGAFFIRCAPLMERNKENIGVFENLLIGGSKFIEAPMHANAYEATWKLDISPTEDELMKGMRKTTRYVIRQVQKNPDVLIERSDKISDLEVYAELNDAVAQRQQFVPFSKDFIRKEFEIFAEQGQVLWFLGKYSDRTIAASMVVFWQGCAYYHQAASLGQYSKLSVPYLLQWEAIREAKRRGCREYDFWGYIDPKTNPKHPWAGPTLFKMGFGGEAYEYIKTQDLPISWKYWPVRWFEQFRKLKRGL